MSVTGVVEEVMKSQEEEVSTSLSMSDEGKNEERMRKDTQR